MSTFESKQYTIFNGEPQKITLSREAIASSLGRATVKTGSKVVTRPSTNNTARISVSWGDFWGVVIADGYVDLPDQNFTHVAIRWTRSRGLLIEEDIALLDSFMETRTRVRGQGKRSNTYTIPGLIQNFDTASAAYLNR